MKARGKVMRAPGAGPGLLMIDGRQFRFEREGFWHSAVPPRPGLNVEVELDRCYEIAGITAVAGTDRLPDDRGLVFRLKERRGPQTAMRRVVRLAVPALLGADEEEQGQPQPGPALSPSAAAGLCSPSFRRPKQTIPNSRTPPRKRGPSAYVSE